MSPASGPEAEHEAAQLRLLPLSPAHLLALIEGTQQFHACFGVRAADGLRAFMVSDDISPAYLEALRTATTQDPWVHGFAVVHGASESVIGTCAFKGPPDEDGVVEIAYGIVPAFQRHGYATRAAAALVAYAFDHAGVRRVRAHTLPERNASTRVLEKCGFEFTGEVVEPEDGVVWRWERARPAASG